MLLQNYLKACAHFSYSPVTCHVAKGDKILLSLGREIIGVDCVFRELGVSQLDINANIYQHRAMVDIGTGYYVQKSVEDARTYFEKKIKFMGRQVEGLTPILQQKVQIRDDVMEVMQYKAQMQQQVARAAAAGVPVAAQ